MIRVDEEQDEGRSLSTESLKTQDQEVIFRPKLKRHASYSSDSLQDPDVRDPLFQANGSDTSGRTKSSGDVRMFTPDIDFFQRDEIFSKVSVQFLKGKYILISCESHTHTKVYAGNS